MNKLSIRALKSKRLSRLRRSIIKPIPLGVGVLILATALLSYRLLTLVPFVNSENPHLLGSATSEGIKNQLIYGPIKFLQILILKLTENDAWLRLASVLFALLSAILLYILLRKWFTSRVSLMASLMYVTSSIFLHFGRITSLEVIYLSVWPALLVIMLWFLSKEHDNKMPLLFICLALLLYVPGTWLFLLVGLIMFRKFVAKALKRAGAKINTLSFLGVLLALLPLAYSFTRGQRQIIDWLGFDTEQKLTLSTFVNNILEIPLQLFYRGFDDPVKWLPGTPIFDVFSVAMLLLGIYAYRFGYYPAREKIVLGAVVLSMIMVGLGGEASILLVIPLLYIVIANGIAYLLQSWFTVFPRNPVAKTIGVSILCAVIAFSMFYQLQRYFVAWPSAAGTKTNQNSNQ